MKKDTHETEKAIQDCLEVGPNLESAGLRPKRVIVERSDLFRWGEEAKAAEATIADLKENLDFLRNCDDDDDYDYDWSDDLRWGDDEDLDS